MSELGCFACRDKLREWLEAHGKTPSRYRHLACHGVHVREMSTPLVTAKRSNCILNSTVSALTVALSLFWPGLNS